MRFKLAYRHQTRHRIFLKSNYFKDLSRLKSPQIFGRSFVGLEPHRRMARYLTGRLASFGLYRVVLLNDPHSAVPPLSDQILPTQQDVKQLAPPEPVKLRAIRLNLAFNITRHGRTEFASVALRPS